MKNIPITILMLLGYMYSSAQSDLFDIDEVKIRTPFNQASKLAHYRYDSISYEKARSQTDFIFEKFSYQSDGHTVSGFSCRRRDTQGRKWPVILYNRGGTGNFGRLNEEDLPDFYTLAQQGFAVYATNYRYIDALGAQDQIGGDDVNDVIHLLEAVKRLPHIDPKNVFMMGVSRGGQMTYQSLARTQVNAAAVIGGVADFHIQMEARPIFLTGWDDLEPHQNYKGLTQVLPDFEAKKTQYLNERSATYWAEKINSPIYILHSRQDGRVPVSGALKLAQRFTALDKSYKLKVFDRKSHGLPHSLFDTYTEIIAWFTAHME
ncbi:alpha/beta hydrolase family protein [Sediminicola luteus]|uniref:Peptidase S9 prolyl oligopeptidase catalytic domain-containing protein n=1 Tax=Sediminicola luteus TaxID=319238 RepID=A0A2A4GFY0_9FLAO|nr:prolyl oligopeptidase family serine peptidase [Sediminicola luteus]PCE66642.1 hypothetical protein B7P33_04935 [Sediminicola luteus]